MTSVELQIERETTENMARHTSQSRSHRRGTHQYTDIPQADKIRQKTMTPHPAGRLGVGSKRQHLPGCIKKGLLPRCPNTATWLKSGSFFGGAGEQSDTKGLEDHGHRHFGRRTWRGMAAIFHDKLSILAPGAFSGGRPQTAPPRSCG